MKKLKVFKALAIFVSVSNVNQAHSELINGIVNNNGDAVEYQYETTSGHYGLKLKSKFKPTVLLRDIGFSDYEACESIHEQIKNGISQTQLDTVLKLDVPSVSDIDIRIKLFDLDQYENYKDLIVLDLKRKGIRSLNPKDKTLITNYQLDLQYELSPDSLLILSKRQDSLRNVFKGIMQSNYDQKKIAINHVSIQLNGNSNPIQMRSSNALIACDLLRNKLKFKLAYRFENSFGYTVRSVQPDALLKIRTGLVENAAFIKEVEENQKNMSPIQSRILASSSVLTAEILKFEEKERLLNPVSFLKIFNGMLDNEGSLIFPYSSESHSNLLGETKVVKFEEIKGVYEL